MKEKEEEEENHCDAPLKGDLSENYILFNLLDYLNGRDRLKNFAIVHLY